MNHLVYVPPTTITLPHVLQQVDVDYNFQYERFDVAFCSTIVIVEEEMIVTVNVGIGHGWFITVTKQSADSDCSIKYQSGFLKHSALVDTVDEVVSKISQCLVGPQVYNKHKDLIDSNVKRAIFDPMF